MWCAGRPRRRGPTRQTTRCGTERIGTIVHTVRVPVRKLARVGRPPSRDRSSARTSASRRGTPGSAPVVAPARESSRSSCGSCQESSAGTSVSDRTPALSAAIHSRAVRASAIAARQPPSRSTYSASRPTRSMSELATSSTGRPRPRWRWSSPLIATPSRIRSRPDRQVLWSKPAIANGSREGPSIPQRMPAWATHRVTRVRSSSVNPNRRRQGSWVARSSTSDAVARPPASSTRVAATASSGLVLDRARSASRTRSRCAGCPRPRRRRPRRRGRTRQRSAVRTSRCRDTSRECRGARGSGRRRGARPAPPAARRPAGPRCGRHAPAGCGRRRGAAGRNVRRHSGAWLVRRSCCSQPSRVSGATTPGAVSAWRPRRAAVAAPGCRDPAMPATGDRPLGRAVVAARNHAVEVGERVPQRGRWLWQPEVDVAVLAERPEQLDLGNRQPGVAEQRQPVREVEFVAARREPLQHAGRAGRRAGPPLPDRAADATARPARAGRRRVRRRRRRCRGPRASRSPARAAGRRTTRTEPQAAGPRSSGDCAAGRRRHLPGRGRDARQGSRTTARRGRRRWWRAAARPAARAPTDRPGRGRAAATPASAGRGIAPRRTPHRRHGRRRRRGG